MRFNLAIEILLFSGYLDDGEHKRVLDVSISQSRYFSFQVSETGLDRLET